MPGAGCCGPSAVWMTFAHLGQWLHLELLTSWCQREHLQLLDRKSTLHVVQPCPKVSWIPSDVTCLQRADLVGSSSRDHSKWA